MQLNLSAVILYGLIFVIIFNDLPPSDLDTVSKSNNLLNRESDSLALVEFYLATDGENWWNKWDLDSSMNTWYGVVVDSVEDRVICLDLDGEPQCLGNWATGNGLNGTVPDLNLPYLTFLSLGGNVNLTGPIPDFSNLPNLTSMGFYGSHITGPVPDFTNLPNLEEFNIGYCRISGPVPDFTKMPKLKYYDVSFNYNITGAAPTLENSPLINIIFLSGNQFEGDLPDYSNKNLIALSFEENNFTGLPDLSGISTWGTDSWQGVDARMNELTFEDIIPNLSIANNSFFSYEGQDSVYVDTLVNGFLNGQVTFDLGIDYEISSNIYEWYKDGTVIDTIYGSPFFSINQIQWSDAGVYSCIVTNPNAPDLTLYSREIMLEALPADCSISGDSIALTQLYTATNGTSWTNKWNFNDSWEYWYGVSKDSFDVCPTLIYLTNNGLSGALPDLELNEVRYISLAFNEIGGFLPVFSSMPALERLFLLNNRFTGTIPDFSGIPLVDSLDLDNNLLTGNIPNFSNLPKLQYLRLQSNQLEGELPDFDKLPELRQFTVYNNRLSGEVPDFTNLPKLTFLDLQSNKFSGTLPDFSNLSVVEYISLYDNLLTGPVPELKNCLNLDTFSVAKNALTFEDILPTLEALKERLSAYYYDTQDSVYVDTTLTGYLTESVTIDLGIDQGIISNKYLWYKDGIVIDSVYGSPEFTIDGLQGADAGIYHCVITNPGAPDLVLRSRNVTVVVTCDRRRDSLALRELYQLTSKSGWINSWDPAEPIDTWFGVGVNEYGCVVCLDLDGIDNGKIDDGEPGGNGLEGDIPDLNLPYLELLNLAYNDLSGSIPNFTYLKNLQRLNLSHNQLEGTIPDFQYLPNLETISLTKNPNIRGGIPSFTNLPQLQFFYSQSTGLDGFIPPLGTNCPNLQLLYLHENQLTFEHILPNISENEMIIGQNALMEKDSFRYAPQDSIYQDTFIKLSINTALNLDLGVDELVDSNIYTWYKDGAFYDTKTGNNDLNIASLQYEDAGVYQVEVTNPQAPKLTLHSRSITLQVYNDCRVQDSLALLSFYNSTDGPNWVNSWDPMQPMDTWYGVFLSEGCVQGLDLDGRPDLNYEEGGDGNGLSGIIPNLDLPNLLTLNLANNELSGTIPNFSGLPSVNSIILSDNDLTGGLPDFQFMPVLKSLSIKNNGLAGPIPDFSGLPELVTLRLDNNQFTNVSIPDFSNLPMLEVLGLNENELTGNIPDFSKLPELRQLYVRDNQLSGLIPEFLNAPHLDRIQINRNGFTFEDFLPNYAVLEARTSSFSYIPQDTIFLDTTIVVTEGQHVSLPLGFDQEVINSEFEWFLNDNNVAYFSLPSAVFSILGATLADAGAYSGTVTNTEIPFLELWVEGINVVVEESCRIKDSLVLAEFYFSANGPTWTNTWDLEEPMDTWYGVHLTEKGCVQHLVMNGDGSLTDGGQPATGNNLSGTLTTAIGNLLELETLWLHENNIQGTIPASIGNLTKLRELWLFNNGFTGSIPASIGDLTSLERLLLYNNRLSGNLPAEIGNLSDLRVLNASNNFITSNIPVEISGLLNLISLNLAFNDLIGSIPDQLGDLVKLQDLRLNENGLSGTIPTSLGNLRDLVWLVLSTNNLEGPLPATLGNLGELKYMWIAQNDLNGSLPSSLGNLSKIEQLILNYNQLTGAIPEEIGDLQNLIRLSLHHNQLSGSIPASLGNLINLQRLFLNDNNLSNCYPASFTVFCQLDAVEYDDQVNGYDLKNNPLLPWQGDFKKWCDGEDQLGAVCNDGLTETTNDVITGNCECEGNLMTKVPESVQVEAGSFTMGCTSNDASYCEADEKPTRWVALQSFEIGKYEVTQEEWQSVMGYNPSQFPSCGSECPVESVHFFDVITYCNRLSIREGLTPCYYFDEGYQSVFDSVTGFEPVDLEIFWLTTANGYRLPTEAEWEYAAKGGNMSQGYWFSGGENINAVAWYWGNSGSSTHRVGAKAPNEIGLYDMTGNVWEWCWDWYQADYYTSSDDCSPVGPQNGTQRTLRGASWVIEEPFCHITNRFDGDPPIELGNYGFRIAKGMVDTVACNQQCHFQDSLRLVKLYDLLQGPNWDFNAQSTYFDRSGETAIPNAGNAWSSALPINQWHGIELDPDGCVRTIILYDVGLSDNLPDLIGSFSALEKLYLNGERNALSGALPVSIGNLFNLLHLDLAQNEFTGSIPDAIGLLSQLTYLNLSDNKLGGSLPTGLYDLALLEVLNLRNNQLTGPISSAIGQIGGLEFLQLYGNELSGSLPVELSQLTNLIQCLLNDNRFTGNIPDIFANLVRLDVIDLSHNTLSGTIPASLAAHSSIADIRLNHNRLSGSFPHLVSTNLETVRLDSNYFISIPDLSNIITWRKQSWGGYQVQDNRLTFSSIEPNVKILQTGAPFMYVPQDSVYSDTVITFYEGEVKQLDLEIDNGINTNIYAWYKDDDFFREIIGTSILNLGLISMEDAGTYRCTVTNSKVPNLELYSRTITVIVEPDPCEDFPSPNGEVTKWYCSGDPIPTLSVELESGQEVYWYFTSTGGTPIAIGNGFQPQFPGNYYAEAVDTASGCSSDGRTLLQVIKNTSPIIGVYQQPVCSEDLNTYTAIFEILHADSISFSTGFEIKNGDIYSILNIPIGEPVRVEAFVGDCKRELLLNPPACDCADILPPVADVERVYYCPGEAIPALKASVPADQIINWYDASFGGQLLIGDSETFIPPGAGLYYAEALLEDESCRSSERTRFFVSQLDAPFIAEYEKFCEAGEQTYTIVLQLERADAITPSGGEPDRGPDNTLIISKIPIDQSIEVYAENYTTGCITSFVSAPPTCGCNILDPPMPEANEISYCNSEVIPAIRVFTPPNITANWYDAPEGGNLLADRTREFQPITSGVYFAESYDPELECSSYHRIGIEVRELPRDILTTEVATCNLDSLEPRITPFINQFGCDSLLIVQPEIRERLKIRLDTVWNCGITDVVTVDSAFTVNTESGCTELVYKYHVPGVPAEEAFAGEDHYYCEIPKDKIFLMGNQPRGVTGRWISENDVGIADPDSAFTEVFRLQPGANIFYWQLSTASCENYSVDTVEIWITEPLQLDDVSYEIEVAGTLNGNPLDKQRLPGTIRLQDFSDYYFFDTLSQPEIGSIRFLEQGGQKSGVFDYSAPGRPGTDFFTYRICERLCPTNCDTALVRINVGCLLNAEVKVPDGFRPFLGELFDPKDALLTEECDIDEETVSLYIYDRWHRRVFKADNYEKWDGKLNNEYLPSGTYWWVLQYTRASGDREWASGNILIYNRE